MKYPRDIFKHECLVLMCVNTVNFRKPNDSKQTRVVFVWLMECIGWHYEFARLSVVQDILYC
jgi:hypothetical protein